MATPTSDPYAGVKPDLGTPIYSGAFTITPGSALPVPTRAIFVGGAGNINFTDMYGNTLTLTGALAGSLLPLRVSAIGNSGAGTTATNIVGLI